MKKSVVKLTVVLVALTIVSIANVNAQSLSGFLYNTTYKEGRMVSKDICKLDKFSGLYNRHLSYEYTYTNDGMLESRKAMRWNNTVRTWENEAVIVYNYDESLSSVTLEYAEWNRKENKFDGPKEKAVYQIMNDRLIFSYTAYEKEDSETNWTIKEHFNINNELMALQMK